jgi:uncharacterized protein YqhQ
MNSSKEMNIGGQAVFEGVMMRGKEHYVVAVRNASKEIVFDEKKISTLTKRFPILKLPFLRGMVMLFETLYLGFLALSFSLEVSGEGELTKREMVVTFILAFILVLLVFIAFPTGSIFFLKRYLTFLKEPVFFSLAEGILKITIFLTYIGIISRMQEIRRVFEYHGAEHKSINAYERKRSLLPEKAREESRFHVSCGTSFILWVFVTMILVYSFLGTTNLWYRVFWRLLLLPIIAGVSYEAIKLARRFRDSWWARFFSLPGIAFQYITTREPSLEQIEVAQASLKRLLELEGVEEAA